MVPFSRPGFCLALAALFLSWVLPGCATRESGYRITDETIAFIQPGVTTRADVVENLGTPLLELKDPRVVAYSWGKMRATGGTPVVRDPATQEQNMQYGMIPQAPEPGPLVETQRWVCCVALDGQDRVTRIGKIELQGAGSLEKAVRQWAGSKGQ